jgi:hypothetical protein
VLDEDAVEGADNIMFDYFLATLVEFTGKTIQAWRLATGQTLDRKLYLQL